MIAGERERADYMNGKEYRMHSRGTSSALSDMERRKQERDRQEHTGKQKAEEKCKGSVRLLHARRSVEI